MPLGLHWGYDVSNTHAWADCLLALTELHKRFDLRL